MKAVIMAGGEGTRLRPITENMAKPFVLIDGKPCIDHVISALARDGFSDILVTMYHKPRDIIEHLGSGERLGANITYSIEDTPLGTFGGVRKNAAFLEETFIVASGDVLADVDFRAIYDAHVERDAIATMALTTVENPTEYGIVGLDARGRIERFAEKPPKEEVFSNLINAGIYVLEPEVFGLYPPNRKVDFSRDLFPKLLDMGRSIYGRELSGLWIDIGRPADLIGAHLSMFVRRLGTSIHVSSGLMEGVRMDGRCYLGKGTGIGREVVLEDAYIYEGCTISSGVRVSDSVLSRHVAVGRDSRITGSFVCDSVRIGKGVVLKNTVLGSGVSVGDGEELVDARIPSGQDDRIAHQTFKPSQ